MGQKCVQDDNFVILVGGVITASVAMQGGECFAGGRGRVDLNNQRGGPGRVHPPENRAYFLFFG